MKTLFTALACLTLPFGAIAEDIQDCSNGQTCMLKAEAYTGPLKLFCIEAPALADKLGVQSRDALRQEIHETIRVLMDSRDMSGTPIAELIREDGWNLGLEQVRSGMAKVWPGGCDETAYVIAEDSAKKAGVGIWAAKAKFTCRGPRYCKQVQSCEEAMFYLMKCGRTDFDRDEDGIPCENICGGGK